MIFYFIFFLLKSLVEQKGKKQQHDLQQERNKEKKKKKKERKKKSRMRRKNVKKNVKSCSWEGYLRQLTSSRDVWKLKILFIVWRENLKSIRHNVSAKHGCANVG